MVDYVFRKFLDEKVDIGDHCCPLEWVRRGIAACRDAGVEPQYFIDRYLHRKPIPMDVTVDKSFRELNARSTDGAIY